MSFILDALKKSESDRQRKNRADSMYVPSGSGESPTSRWILIVGFLLMVNVVILTFVVLKPDQEVDAISVANTETTIDEESASFRDLVANAKRGQQQVEPARPVLQPVADSPPIETSRTANPATYGTVIPPSTSSTAYRTFNDVRLDGSVQLSDLHLDIHVFSGTPEERFVFVNMHKYKERSTLSEGPLVAEIVPEGVILEYMGTKFLLPRE